MTFAAYLVAYVLLLTIATYGVVAKDWRASFGSAAIALVLLIMLVVEHR